MDEELDDPRSPEETAAALDLLAGGKADAFVAAAVTQADQGDLTLALDILTPSADGAEPDIGSVRLPGLCRTGWCRLLPGPIDAACSTGANGCCATGRSPGG